MVFEKIKQAIMADPLNKSFTDQGIEPLYKVSAEAVIVLVGQAPGRIAQETNMVWNDISGDRLREWMEYQEKNFTSRKKSLICRWISIILVKAKRGIILPEKGLLKNGIPVCLRKCPR